MNRPLLVLACVLTAVACERRETPPDQPPEKHARLIAAPAGGEVAPIVREQIALTTAAKRRLIVYEGAVWCEPCQHLHRALQEGALDATFPDLDLLEFDHDRDLSRLKAAGYTSKYIPLLALPNEDGRASGKYVEGGILGEGAVAEIAPRLQALLRE
jgi:hypothetical protein